MCIGLGGHCRSCPQVDYRADPQRLKLCTPVAVQNVELARPNQHVVTHALPVRGREPTRLPGVVHPAELDRAAGRAALPASAGRYLATRATGSRPARATGDGAGGATRHNRPCTSTSAARCDLASAARARASTQRSTCGAVALRIVIVT